MIRINCHTNLDLAYEKWPELLPAVPRVGDEIQSKANYRGFQLTLQVVGVVWESHRKKTTDPNYDYSFDDWIPRIELHMTDFQRRLPSKKGETGSIVAFYEWYAPLVGRTVSSFI